MIELNVGMGHPRRMFSKVSSCLILGSLFVLIPALQAVEKHNINNSIDSSDPHTDPWKYVGSIGGASGVYLGNSWVLTAAHVGMGTFTLAGVPYNAVPNSAFSFTNSLGTLADLTLFKISSGPTNLNPMPILSSHPSTGTGADVQMIGFGGGTGESWGQNHIYNYIPNYSFITGGASFGPGIVTLANDSGSDGAQGITGDSGGGMFYKIGDTWSLIGILSGAGSATDIQGHSLGDATISVDLSYYATQIAADMTTVSFSAIPEPSTYAAILGFGALLTGIILRRRVVRC